MRCLPIGSQLFSDDWSNAPVSHSRLPELLPFWLAASHKLAANINPMHWYTIWFMGKGLIYLSIFICGTLGSYVPTWFGTDFFSLASIVGGIIGSFIGIWIAVKLGDYV